MKKTFLIVLTVFIFTAGSVFAAVSPKIFYTGIIGKNLNIHMTLQFQGNKISGAYYYDKYKTPINLSGSYNFWDCSFNEYDGNGKVIGIFKGYLNSRAEIEGTWSKPDGSKSLPFSIRISRTDRKFNPAEWAGKWENSISGGVSGKSLAITKVNRLGFEFTLSANNGANIGEIKGTAKFSNESATWVDKEQNAEIRFFMLGDTLSLTASEGCSYYGGAGVTFGGDFVPEGKAIQMSLTDSGVFDNPAQETVFKKLVKDDYQLFRSGFSSIAVGDDSDGFGAKVSIGWIRGIAGMNDCIVMVTPANKIWAAVVEDVTLKYYTTEPGYARKLPKTIEKWSQEKETRYKIIFMNR